MVPRRSGRRPWAFVLAALLVGFSRQAFGQSDSSWQRGFYHPQISGSDAQFNPATVVLNEGFDMLRIITDRRTIGEIPYRQSSAGLWYSVTHPDGVVRHYGVGRWVRSELLPLSLHGKGGAAWAPNYQLHLFGAGMTYAHMAEWYEARDVEHPRIAAATTLFAGHVLNEIVENAGNPSRETEESLTDLVIFDPAGMLLWNTEWMRRAFSGPWEVNNWYGQATWIPRTHRLENTFTAHYVRAPLPKTDNWKAFTLQGDAFLVGVSRRLRDSLMLSVAGGPMSAEASAPDSGTSPASSRAANFGAFLDRNGSLLISVVRRTGNTNGPTLNVYPGVLRVGRFAPGFWIQSVRGGHDGRGLRWGFTSALGGGLGSISR